MEGNLRFRSWFTSVVFFLVLSSPVLAQIFDDAEDDVSASYDYDGTLILNSRNFRGMTQSGIWVVMFYSYSVVIKDTKEAYDCQKFTWLWGDFANRMSNLGGQPQSGDQPTMHVAKYDTSHESERRFVSMLLSGQKIDSLPGVFIFEGSTVRKMDDYSLAKIINNFPDIDRLEGYARGLKCDPPADYYDALEVNRENLYRLSRFVTEYLSETGRGKIDVAELNYDDPDDPGVDWDWDTYDPVDEIMDAARAAVRSGDRAGFVRMLERMEAVNDTDVNVPTPPNMMTPLHFAALGGEVEVVELLLSVGAQVEGRCSVGETALFKAAEAGRRGVLRVLLDAGADVHAPRSRDGASPLHMAALAGRGDVCLTLLRHGADVELRTPKGQSPMHFTAMGGHLEEPSALQILMENGADIEGQDYMGWTPLMHAVYVNEVGVITKLCELGVDVEQRDLAGNTALHHAMHYGMEHNVKELLRFGASPWAQNRGGEKAMEVLSAYNNWQKDAMTGQVTFVAKAKKRFDLIMKPYRQWWWPGYWWGDGMRLDFKHKLEVADAKLKQMISTGIKTVISYFKDNTPTFFHMAFFDVFHTRNKYEVFEAKRLMEIEEFQDKQTWGGDNEGDIWLYDMGDEEFERLKTYTPLQRATYFQQWWVVEELLEKGRVEYAVNPGLEMDQAQILIPSNGGGTIRHGCGELRFQGSTVDVDVVDETGATPIMVATNNGDVRTVGILAKYGADLEATDKYGTTALMKAVSSGNVEIMELLLRMGADPENRLAGDLNQTALMLAATEGDMAAALLLLRFGANLDARDVQGRTPMNYAHAAARHSLVEWMRNKGAVMRDDGACVGALLTFERPQPGDYSPIDFPESDWRNPRYSGPMG